MVLWRFQADNLCPEAIPNLILALETSGRHGSVALLREGKLLASGKIAAHQRTAAAMTPLIADVMRSAGLALQAIDLVGVTVGPGSFTGLRVGVTTAKTLAYALKCQVIGVNTLDVIARQAPPSAMSVRVVVDAQRQQLFAAHYQREAQGPMATRQPTEIIDKEAWLKSLGADECVMGPALGKLQRELPPEVHVIDPTLWEPTAASVGTAASDLFATGQRDDFWKLVPLYFRASAAEEKLLK